MESMIPFVGLAYMLMLGIVAIIADERNVKVAQIIFISIILTPIIGLLVTFMAESKRDAELKNAAYRAILKHLNEPIPGEKIKEETKEETNPDN